MKCLSISVALVLASLASTGWGYHETDQPQNVRTTAYSLPKAEHMIGLFDVRYGITDDVEVGFSPPTWGILFPNAALGWRFLAVGPVDVKASVSAVYASTRLVRVAVDVPKADVAIVPAQLVGSFAMTPDLRLSLGALFTGIVIDGVLDEELVAGGAATTNMQLHTTIGWRVSPRVAFEVRGTYQAFQSTKARVAARAFPDEFTEVTAEAVAESDVLEFPHAFNVVLMSHLSWETFNLLMGVGYGNYTIPVVNFVLPERGFVPRLDFYWRF